jgi:hypothetical protein
VGSMRQDEKFPPARIPYNNPVDRLTTNLLIYTGR